MRVRVGDEVRFETSLGRVNVGIVESVNGMCVSIVVRPTSVSLPVPIERYENEILKVISSGNNVPMYPAKLKLLVIASQPETQERKNRRFAAQLELRRLEEAGVITFSDKWEIKKCA